MFLSNVGVLPHEYMAQQPRRPQSEIYFNLPYVEDD
jgi:hypothetical protein